MTYFDSVFSDLDNLWGKIHEEQISLNIIGSVAIMLQMNYTRATKDPDILEVTDISPDIAKKLKGIAGKGTPFEKRHSLFLELVKPGIPFLPQKPKFHPIRSAKKLHHLTLFALDLTEILISKLIRFKPSDIEDIQAIVKQKKINHTLLIDRFKSVMDSMSMDARAEDLPKLVKNLHTVERTYFEIPETEIALPDWIGE